MTDAQKLALVAVLTAAVTLGALVVVESREPEPSRRMDVRAWKLGDGGTLYGYEATPGRKETIVASPPTCVIPACDESEKPVDCLRNGRWRGCNVIPASESSGAECLPASCWLYFGEAPEK
jgi:hypothetical protein